mgnify:CR=1 FL=1
MHQADYLIIGAEMALQRSAPAATPDAPPPAGPPRTSPPPSNSN